MAAFSAITFFSGRITILEIAWVVLGLIFLGLALQNVRDANRDLHAIIALKRNGLLRDIAIHAQIMEWTRVVISLSGVIAGIAAMFAIPANPSEPISTLQIIVTFTLFTIFIGVGVQIIKSRRMRIRLIEQAEKER